MAAERLQKILARAGLASRRKAEEWIAAGRVAVDGEIIAELGAKADPARQRITVDGRPVGPAEAPRYLLFHKPRGVVSTLSDPQGRPALPDFLPRGKRTPRLYPVGRLDFHSEGLMLLTNDGALAHRALRASSHLPKTYWVKISGRPGEAQLERLRRGVYLPAMTATPNGPRAARAARTAPARIRWLGARGASAPGAARGNAARGPADRRDSASRPRRSGGPRAGDNPWLEVVLIEGRQNQIRRMFQLISHPVEKLRRVRIGPLELGSLPPGGLRPLAPSELNALRRELRGERATKSREVSAARAGRRAESTSAIEL